MNNIEIKVLNPDVIKESEKMMICSARLTQSGHKIKNMQDFIDLYNKSYTEKTSEIMVNLPHPTIQKFGVINIAIVGASRRFLAQITRHQNEIKFMSASLQYSNYSNEADFVIPYEIINDEQKKQEYLNSCKQSMQDYEKLVKAGINHDDAAYCMPQGLRNILIMSATPYEFKHIISQRVCRRNTKETRYVMLLIWKELYKLNPIFFGNCGPFCMLGPCKEGKFACGNPIEKGTTPEEILKTDFKDCYEKSKN